MKLLLFFILFLLSSCGGNKGTAQNNPYGEPNNYTNSNPPSEETYRGEKIPKSIKKVKEVGIGMDFICVLDENDDLICWGSDLNGKVVNFSKEFSKKFKHITVNYTRLCAIDTSDESSCIMIHNKTMSDVHKSNVESIAILGEPLKEDKGNYCVILKSGELECWGKDDIYQQPLKDFINSLTTKPKFAKVYNGDFLHDKPCFITDDGSLGCFNYDKVKNLWDGYWIEDKVKGNLDFSSILNSLDYPKIEFCYINKDQKLKCSSTNSFKNSKDLELPDSYANAKFKEVKINSYFGLVIKEDGTGAAFKTKKEYPIGKVKYIESNGFNICYIDDEDKLFCKKRDDIIKAGTDF